MDIASQPIWRKQTGIDCNYFSTRQCRVAFYLCSLLLCCICLTHVMVNAQPTSSGEVSTNHKIGPTLIWTNTGRGKWEEKFQPQDEDTIFSSLQIFDELYPKKSPSGVPNGDTKVPEEDTTTRAALVKVYLFVDIRVTEPKYAQEFRSTLEKSTPGGVFSIITDNTPLNLIQLKSRMPDHASTTTEGSGLDNSQTEQQDIVDISDIESAAEFVSSQVETVRPFVVAVTGEGLPSMDFTWEKSDNNLRNLQAPKRRLTPADEWNMTPMIFSQLLVIVVMLLTVCLGVCFLTSIDPTEVFEEKVLVINKEF